MAMVLVVVVVAAACGSSPVATRSSEPDRADDTPRLSAAAIQEIAISPSGSCAILRSGRVTCWGSWSGAPATGQISPAAGAQRLRDIVELRIGVDTLAESRRFHEFLCARDRAAQVLCWGNNHDRQLGNDASSTSIEPGVVAGLGPAKQIALGSRHACALQDDGKVWCWGSNEEGQSGAGQGVELVARPSQVSGQGRVIALSATQRNTCAIRDDHRTYCWGLNRAGQSSGSTGSDSPHSPNSVTWQPVEVRFARGATQLAASRSFTCAIVPPGSIVCWGHVARVLGDPAATRVPGVDDAVAVALGHEHGCAIRRDGTLVCWGNNELGALGLGTRSAEILAPQPVPLPGRVTRITAAAHTTCAGLDDRRWLCWGANLAGQIGPVRQGQGAQLSPALLDLSRITLLSP